MTITGAERKAEDMRAENMEIFREMIMEYGIFDLEEARRILGEMIKGKLSDTVIELREEE